MTKLRRLNYVFHAMFFSYVEESRNLWFSHEWVFHFVMLLAFSETCSFLFRHKKQKDEDIAICVCQYTADDPESACGEQCLNVLTSTECTPGYCQCGEYCKNQVCISSPPCRTPKKSMCCT